MHQRKSKKVLIYLFLLMIVSSIGNNSINNFKFSKIEKINISGLDQIKKQILQDKLNKINLENIFFVDKNEIIKLINSHNVIEKFKVFKKYPSTIDVKIESTTFLAQININGKNFLIGSNGKLIANQLNHNELPYIFGKPNIKEFLNFKNIIDNSKFSYEQIKDLYYFQSKRWDMKLKNKILIRLPNNFSQETLDKLYEFLEIHSNRTFTIIDARIKNQIILNE